MKSFSQSKFIFLLFAAFGLTACQPTTTTTTVNSNQTMAANENANLNVDLSNMNSNSQMSNSANSTMNKSANSVMNNSTGGSNAAIEANEPEQYQATVTLKLEAGGNDKKTAFPAISAQVARAGVDHRIEFTLPNGEKIIYLDIPGHHLIISPSRKEYGELDRASLGIDVRRLLTPAEIVSQVKSLNGVKRVGEEKYNGRDAVKYTYNAVTNTQTNAGNVNTESVIYVDKATGLPLHSETVSASPTNSVNGINNLRLVTEMTNLQTTVDQNLFAEPVGYQKVAPEQIRQQLDTLFKIAGAFIAQMMQTTSAASPSPTPAAPK